MPPRYHELMSASDSARISKTAHYTGYVWYRRGLSHPAFATRAGALLYGALTPVTRTYRRVVGYSLEDALLARHLGLNALLASAIEAGQVGQVVEIAAGLSARGYRMCQRFGDRLTAYVEGDLPHMCSRKRAMLVRSGWAANHHVVAMDALAEAGPTSLFGATEHLLDPRIGTAVVTEGLITYFDPGTVQGIWRRICGLLATFPQGLYLSDVYLRQELLPSMAAKALLAAMTVFVRGAAHVHYADPPAVLGALSAAGFATSEVIRSAEAAQDVPAIALLPAMPPGHLLRAETIHRDISAR